MAYIRGLSLIKDKTEKKSRGWVPSIQAKTIRVICCDPDATDSSSGDEADQTVKPRFPRRVVTWIPSVSQRRRRQRKRRNSDGRTGYRGVRRRKCVIREPDTDDLRGEELLAALADDGSPFAGVSGDRNPPLTTIHRKLEKHVTDLEQLNCCREIRSGMEIESIDELLVDDFGGTIDDFACFGELLVCNSGKQRRDLPEFDWDLGNDELTWWIH